MMSQKYGRTIVSRRSSSNWEALAEGSADDSEDGISSGKGKCIICIGPLHFKGGKGENSRAGFLAST